LRPFTGPWLASYLQPIQVYICVPKYTTLTGTARSALLSHMHTHMS
jgi:hypothetical protein